MTGEIAFVLITIGFMMGCLILEVQRPELIVFTTVIVFLLTGMISAEEAFKGFSNEGMLTIGLFFILAGGIQKSDWTNHLIQKMLHARENPKKTLLKILIPISGISAFLNNTPIVVTFTPIIRKWCENHHISPSKFLIPLSYATILGGTMTIMGTSTNLVVHGLLLEAQLPGLSFFQLGIVGLPITLLGILYLATAGYALLPDDPAKKNGLIEDSREYMGEVKVTDDYPFLYKTIEEASLRNLNGLYLMGIIRDQEVHTPVSSTSVIKPGDHLLFTGLISAIGELQKQKGLELVINNDTMLELIKNKNTKIVEAVVSQYSSLLHKKIKDTQFRGKYDAAVIAVHRKKERMKSKIGDIILKPGDILLMIIGPDFSKRDYSHEFYLVHPIEQQSFLKVDSKWKSWSSILVLTALILCVSTGILSMLTASAAAVCLFFILKIVTASEARKFLQLNVLILIASSFGIGSALIHSGTAEWIANGLVSLVHPLGKPILILAVMYLATNLLTEFITNNAAAVIMFPIALEVAGKTEIDPTALAIIVAISASASFSTPIGYQTNMIVYGPGGYTYKDFLKAGLPLNIIVMAVTVWIVYLVWV